MTNDRQDEVKLIGRLTYHDFKTYNLFHQKSTLIAFFVLANLLFLLILATSTTFLFSLLFALMLSTVTTIALRGLLLFRVRREFNSDQLTKSEMRYMLNNNSIIQQSERSKMELTWSDVLKVRRCEDIFLLYVAKSKAVVLPQRFFSSKEDIYTFLDLIHRNMNEEKIKI